MARNHSEGKEIPGLKDQVIGLEEIMDWVASHTTIKEEGTDERACFCFPGICFNCINVYNLPSEK